MELQRPRHGERCFARLNTAVKRKDREENRLEVIARMMRWKNVVLLTLLTNCAPVTACLAQQKPPPPPPIIGRWDLTVNRKDGPVPSWFEVELSGFKTLVGRFVGAFGSARPIGEVHWKDGRFAFSMPVQWEDGDTDIRVEGEYANNRIRGTISGPFFGGASFTGVRAPKLVRAKPPAWGNPLSLFDGRTLKGWHARNPKAKNGWVVRNGLLVNAKPGNDLVTDRTFTDFKLHAEFRYPKDSNSGIYLRGRYEAQIEDEFGKSPDSHPIGGIYGFLGPRVNAAKHAGEWQSYDIVLTGREVTVWLNGKRVICEREIPGITGGALDSNESLPGPLMVQGDHGPIEFRKLVLTPAK